MVTYKEKVEGCIYISSLLETIAFRNGRWEFNNWLDVRNIDMGMYMNYMFLHEYNALGGMNNINFDFYKSSDDTILNIATAEAVINGGGEDNYITAYLKWYNKLKEDKRFSGVSTLSSLEIIKHKKSIHAIKYNSSMGGNGAAIRTAPIGLKYYNDYEKVIEEAYIASRVTHNYYLGFLGGIVTALFTAFAVKNISPFEWNKKMLELYEDAIIFKIIKKHTDSFEDIEADIRKYFTYWKKYEVERCSKFNMRGLEIFLMADVRVKHLMRISTIDYMSNQANFNNVGGSGLESVIIAYDNLLMSAIPTDKTKTITLDIKNAKFSIDSLAFYNLFFFGDNDSIAAISGAWFGAYFGIDKFPMNKIKELEFYPEMKKIVDTF